MLDKLKAQARHFIIAALPLVATFILTNVIPNLQGQYAESASISFVLTLAALYLTPLTRQYGVGRKAGEPTTV